ncbi:uncharacterized protein [Amphiura filiformis]|uniref:uncharacterized protein n=1 Tax=Amphiura filiformis TaxID=82378 RepID=UPI003B22403B
MAEAGLNDSSLSLASTIDRHFLECVICSDIFNDPRALPCMHPFCCECLENWAKSCSNDNSIVSCPLCKNIYRIPEEEGIKGFPGHFLVTNLQDTLDKAKQKKSSTNYCENHKGKKCEYFCENCGCAACSDCSALDPSHRGHSFIRLKEASRPLSSSLENLSRIVGNVEEKYTTAIQQTQQVKQNLDKDTDAKIQAIDEARNEHMQQVDNLVRAYKQDAYRKKKENVKTIEQIEEKLRVDLASLRSSNELASNVIESGSDSDIISLYPSLSSALQQLTQAQPIPVDSKLGEIKLEPPQPTSMDLPSLEQLLCNKLHITVAPTQHTQVSHQTTNLPVKPAAAAKPLPSATAKHLPSSAAAKSPPTGFSVKSSQSSTIKPLSAFTANAQVNAATASRQDSSDSLYQRSRSVPSTQGSTQPSTDDHEHSNGSNSEAAGESFNAVDTLDQISTLIGPAGGTVKMDNNIAHLDIPPGALDKQIQITLSMLSETDHPTLGDMFIIAPIVRLEPDGLRFLRPVTLTVKHAAVGRITNLEVWTKTAGHNWQLGNDSQTGNNSNTLLSKDVVKIRMAHFCIKCILGRSKLRVQIQPFIPVDLRRSKKIGLTVYALKTFHVKSVQDEMAKKNHVCCLNSVVQVYDINRHKKLEIDLKDVKDKNNTDAWEVTETPKNINAENINKSPGNAKCCFALTPKDEKIDSIIATLNVQRKPNDPDAIAVDIIHIMQHSLQPKNTRLLAAAAKATGTSTSNDNEGTVEQTSTAEAAVHSTSPSPCYKNDIQMPSCNPVQVFHLILDDARDVLHDNLNTNNILMRLKSRRILNAGEVAEINNIHGLGERVNMLLAILKTKDVKAYEEFMSALREFDHDLYCEVKKIEKRYPHRL